MEKPFNFRPAERRLKKHDVPIFVIWAYLVFCA